MTEAFIWALVNIVGLAGSSGLYFFLDWAAFFSASGSPRGCGLGETYGKKIWFYEHQNLLHVNEVCDGASQHQSP